MAESTLQVKVVPDRQGPRVIQRDLKEIGVAAERASTQVAGLRSEIQRLKGGANVKQLAEGGPVAGSEGAATSAMPLLGALGGGRELELAWEARRSVLGEMPATEHEVLAESAPIEAATGRFSEVARGTPAAELREARDEAQAFAAAAPSAAAAWRAAGGEVRGVIDGLAEDGFGEARAVAEDFGRAGRQALRGLIVDFRDLESVAAGLSQRLADIAFDVVFDALAGGGARPLAGGGVLGLLGFAHGGRPPMGEAVVVGERGPELFVADRPGRIVPPVGLDAEPAPRGDEGREVAIAERSLKALAREVAFAVRPPPEPGPGRRRDSARQRRA